jgi:protein TonB
MSGAAPCGPMAWAAGADRVATPRTWRALAPVAPLQTAQWVLPAALGLSLALHLGVWLLWWHAPGPAPAPATPLVVDLGGVLSLHQAEAQQQARPAKPAPPAAAPARIRWALAAHDPGGVPATEAREPRADDDRPREPEPAPAASPQAVPAAAGGEQARIAQTVAHVDTEADAMRRYLGALKKALQARLVYPPQARAAGEVGAPVIRFVLTEQGEIQPGSLVVHQSSGHATLDAAALQAAQTSTPLPPPPKAMTVVVALSFIREP